MPLVVLPVRVLPQGHSYWRHFAQSLLSLDQILQRLVPSQHLVFTRSKLSFCGFNQQNSTSCLVTSLSGASTVLRSGVNLLRYCTIPRNLLSSSLLCWSGMSRIAFTLSGHGSRPFSETTWTTYFTLRFFI